MYVCISQISYHATDWDMKYMPIPSLLRACSVDHLLEKLTQYKHYSLNLRGSLRKNNGPMSLNIPMARIHIDGNRNPAVSDQLTTGLNR